MLSLAIGLFLIGAFLGFFNRKLSYFVAFLASLLSFVIGFNAEFNGIVYKKIFPVIFSISSGLFVDKLGGLFLMIASVSWIAVSVFSMDFGENYRKRMAIFVNLAMLGMLLILAAFDGVMFLIGWEIMTIASYLLVVEHDGAYKEAFQFLAFSEISTMSLILAFVFLYSSINSLRIVEVHSQSVLFLVFASLAFIIKMGIVPFHTWLKEAHSKAPSNVSALLSAPVTLMGVYGLTRVIYITGYTHSWGILAIIFGSVSAFWGAMEAAAAKGLKVLPAYSTVENNGMILAALGLSALAYSFSKESTLYEFAFMTAIILSITHTIAKTLLFLSIGEAKEKLHEESIDNVRGIHKSVGKIPAFGVVISGLSFSAFPTLLGYVAEWMLLESIFQSYQFQSILDRVVSSTGGVFLSLAMGFASFSMIKLIGYSALGYHHEKKAKPMPSLFMHLSEIFLMGLIIGISFFATIVFVKLGYAKFVIGALGVPNGWLIASAKPVFGVISPAFFVLVVLTLFFVPFVIYLNKRKRTKKVVSWNGGLALNDDEYFTANAFSFIVEYILRFVYRTKEVRRDKEAFVVISDVFESVYAFLVKVVEITSYNISKFIMNGKIYFYLLYILVIFVGIFVLFGRV
ncbi:proton-conducting transporter membrane subunit [Hippea alviniae]|uniref:proton-conducting transporter transmembrane domain-containing protein n=1 Tax=Hippea alviniae TaxID=1279027 RepID=UPI0003B4CF30|nr:proton-conducting transporter membrane subunit [Hippea alviniae]